MLAGIYIFFIGERDKDISTKMSQKAASPYKRGYTKKRGQTKNLLLHIYGDCGIYHKIPLTLKTKKNKEIFI